MMTLESGQNHQVIVSSMAMQARNLKLIGGTDSIYFWPIFQGIPPENMAKHMVRLRTSVLGSCFIPIEGLNSSFSLR